MLNPQCSEEKAYRRIAIFVKTHAPASDKNSIDRLLAYDKESLLEKADTILTNHPNEIDKI
jgi:hypothetical protein